MFLISTDQTQEGPNLVQLTCNDDHALPETWLILVNHQFTGKQSIISSIKQPQPHVDAEITNFLIICPPQVPIMDSFVCTVGILH